MANTDYAMGNGEDFSQDIKTDEQLLTNGQVQNGSGDAPADSGSAEAPGRDDDRYELFPYKQNFD